MAIYLLAHGSHVKLQNCHGNLSPKFLDTTNKAIVSVLKGHQNGILVKLGNNFTCVLKKIY